MNKKSLSFLLLALVAMIGFFSCRKPDVIEKAADPANNYFPLKRGHYIIYDVDSTTWDSVLCVELKKSYQIMYRVADTFTDNIGRPSYRIETLMRKWADTTWQHHRVYYATAVNDQLEYVENELRFIKLTFPVENGRTWKGNAYVKSGDSTLSYFEGWDYKYTNMGMPYNNGNVIYNNTVTVEQIDVAENDPETLPKSYASRTFGKEIYARDIGMVYKEYYHWVYDPSIKNCRRGKGVKMQAVEYNY